MSDSESEDTYKHTIFNKPLPYYLDLTVRIENTAKLFKYNNQKFKFTVKLIVAIHPKVHLGENLISLFSDTIAEKTTDKVLSETLHHPTDSLTEALQTQERKLKFTKFLIRIHKQLAKQIRKLWDRDILRIQIFQTNNSYIF